MLTQIDFSGGRELDGVGHKVVDHLIQGTLVGQHERRVVGEVLLDHDRLAKRGLGIALDGGGRR
jgi:hypothetical protein